MGRRWRFVILPEAAPVLRDLEQAESDFMAVRYRNFSEREKARYESSAKKISENVKDVLRS